MQVEEVPLVTTVCASLPSQQENALPPEGRADLWRSGPQGHLLESLIMLVGQPVLFLYPPDSPQ